LPVQYAQAQCQAAITAGAIITPSASTPVHIGDTLSIQLIYVANQALSVMTTNVDLYFVMPDNSSNHIATGVTLSASTLCGGPGSALFGCPFLAANAGGDCLASPTSYTVNSNDLHKNLSISIAEKGASLSFGNGGGHAKEIDFIVAAAGQGDNGNSATAGLLFTRKVVFPSIAVTKNCPTNAATTGAAITFTGTITNTGDITLTNIALTDLSAATVTFDATTFRGRQFPDPIVGMALGTNDSVNYTVTYQPANSQLVNTVTVTAQDLTGYSVSNTTTASCLGQPISIFGARFKDMNFVFSFATETGHNYTVEFTDGLSPANWQAMTNVPGDGTVATMADRADHPQRFYRLVSH
jgi:uncharacterized repeat protein (TIGR01451 family)